MLLFFFCRSRGKNWNDPYYFCWKPLKPTVCNSFDQEKPTRVSQLAASPVLHNDLLCEGLAAITVDLRPAIGHLRPELYPSHSQLRRFRTNSTALVSLPQCARQIQLGSRHSLTGLASTVLRTVPSFNCSNIPRQERIGFHF